MGAERRAGGFRAAGKSPDIRQQAQQRINRGTLVSAVSRNRGHKRDRHPQGGELGVGDPAQGGPGQWASRPGAVRGGWADIPESPGRGARIQLHP